MPQVRPDFSVGDRVVYRPDEENIIFPPLYNTRGTIVHVTMAMSNAYVISYHVKFPRCQELMGVIIRTFYPVELQRGYCEGVLEARRRKESGG